MKRLTAALLALLIAVPAAAYDKSVAVVYGDFNYFPNFLYGMARQVWTVQRILERHGVTYDVYAKPPTNWCRTGVFGTSPSISGMAQKSYRAVIHVGVDHGASSYGGGLTYDPRDLTFTGAVPGRGDSLPTVPQLFVYYATSEPSLGSSAACSSGTAGTFATSYSDMNSTAPLSRDYGWVMYHPQSGLKTRPEFAHAPAKASALGSGYGWRGIVGMATSASADTICHTDCDSTTVAANPDTVAVWALTYPQTAHAGGGKKPIVFALGGVSQPDPITMSLAIAYLDSLCDGNLITKQQKIAFHVDDGWRRGAAAGTNGGLYAPDSAYFKATLDSIRVNRIPVTFGAQISSMHQYVHQDSIWLVRHARDYFRITPHTHVGMDPYTTTGLQETVFGGSNPTTAPGMVDLFGSSRTRILYPYDWTGGWFDRAAADSTVGSLQLAALLELKRRFPGKVDGLAMPPTDDWTPTFASRTNFRHGIDSLARVLKLAGYVGTRTNVSCAACVGYTNGESGFSSNPMRIPIRDSDGYIESYFPVVATPGYRSNGSMQWKTGADRHAINVKAFYFGLTGPDPSPSVNNNPWVPCNIFAMHTNDLAGNPANYTGADKWGGHSTEAKRPGWWEIKWTANWARMMNLLAGRTIVDVTWPENVAAAQAAGNDR